MLVASSLLLLLILFAKGFSCPDGWIGRKTSCYLLITTKQTWAESQFECAGYGAALAKVETAEENIFLRGYLEILADLGGDMSTWIGGDDMVRDGVWEWSSGGRKMNFTDWAQGQPQGHEKENCLLMYNGHDFHWDDAPCTKGYRAICEMQQNK